MGSKSTAARPGEEKAAPFIAGARGPAGQAPVALLGRATAEKRQAMKPGLY